MHLCYDHCLIIRSVNLVHFLIYEFSINLPYVPFSMKFFKITALTYYISLSLCILLSWALHNFLLKKLSNNTTYTLSSKQRDKDVYLYLCTQFLISNQTIHIFLRIFKDIFVHFGFIM